MKTRSRRPVQEAEEVHEDDLFLDVEEDYDLERFSEEELEALLFDEEPQGESKGILNLPTIAGLSMILVGVGYIFQQLGFWNTPFNFELLVSMLPWLAGVLIILLGFGVLSWGPKRRKAKVEKKVTKTVRTKTRQGGERQVVVEKVTASRDKDGKKRLAKTRDKKIAGVAGGIADYFNIDPTLVRIAFVIGTIASQGSFLLAYLILSFVMPDPDKPKSKRIGKSTSKVEERITIIRDK